QRKARVIPLSAAPAKVTAMPEPGLVLLINAPDPQTSQLWLIDVLAGDKVMVDSDCADFSLATDSKLLVRAKSKNELRVYELIGAPREEAPALNPAPAAPAPQDKGS